MTFEEQQPGRGYLPKFRPGERNYCPGCGRVQWIIGRVSAECAFCETALDLPESTRGEGSFVRKGRPR